MVRVLLKDGEVSVPGSGVAEVNGGLEVYVARPGQSPDVGRSFPPGSWMAAIVVADDAITLPGVKHALVAGLEDLGLKHSRLGKAVEGLYQRAGGLETMLTDLHAKVDTVAGHLKTLLAHLAPPPPPPGPGPSSESSWTGA